MYFAQSNAQDVLDALNAKAVLLPDGYVYRALNNANEEVETTVDINGVIYGVRIYSNNNFLANGQEQHKQIYVKLNGTSADDAMAIISNYRTNNRKSKTTKRS
jgi:hypothetical protein